MRLLTGEQPIHVDGKRPAETQKLVVGNDPQITLDFTDVLLIDVCSLGLHPRRKLVLRQTLFPTLLDNSFGDQIFLILELHTVHRTSPIRQTNVIIVLTLAW